VAESKVDLGTCKRCGANLRKVRVNHISAIKGDDDWSDVTACPNKQCPDYYAGSHPHSSGDEPNWRDDCC